MKTIDQHIEEVGDWFDFEKVAKVMVYLNWKWIQSDGTMAVPQISELRKNVRKKMRELHAEYSPLKKCSVSLDSGGIKVDYNKYERDGKVFDNFAVYFVLTDWNTENG